MVGAVMPLAAGDVPGTFPTVEIGGCGSFCTFNYQTLITSALAILLTIAVVYLVAYRLLRPGRPTKFQMIFELVYDYIRGMARQQEVDDSRVVVPLAMSIATFILIANWLEFFPLDLAGLHPPTADWNQTFAMAVVVFVVAQVYSIRVLGVRGFLRRFTGPFDLSVVMRVFLTPLHVISEVMKPVSLSLRLFGNLFAGGVMIYLITLLLGQVPVAGPWVISPLTLVLWKLFDVFFIGTLQAFIFFLLTIIYFGQAVEGTQEHAH